MPKAPALNEQTDDDLGIGRDDIADILANPIFAKAIEAAVAEKLAEKTGLSVGGDNPQFQGLLAAVERMFQLQAIQQPGYIKPISSEEMERRASGKVEMEALLRDYQQRNLAPKYTLGGEFYAGDVLYMAGQTVRTFLPPAEHFQPENEPAEKVYAAMLQWIGGHTQAIGEQVEAAMVATKSAVPLITGGLPVAPPSPVEVLSEPLKDVRPKRVAGTSVPETHGVTLPQMPATAAMPSGPVFINP